jgi:hypothetical protein
MFKLSDKQTYTWPVRYQIANAGKYEVVEFTCEFPRMTQSRLEELFNLSRDNKLNDDEFIREILLGWTGIRTSENTDFEYSDANRDLLLDTYPGLRAAVINAFAASVQGSVRKN